MDENKIKLTLDTNPTNDVNINDLQAQPFIEEKIEQVALTTEEKQMVDNFSQQIDIRNSQQILEYGSGVQKKMSNFSDQTLSTIKTKDMGEIGSLISSLVVELKDFSITGDKKGIFSFLNKAPKKAQMLKANYDKAETNVNNIVRSLEKQQVNLMKDVAMLDQMYDMNKNYYKEISMYILAGKQKLQQIKSNDLPQLTTKANMSNSPEDVQNLNDLNTQINRFEKKLHDLELSKMISIQTAPQIRMVQNNNTEMIEKIQSTIVNTIPLWKNQMVLALGVQRSNEAIKTQQAVSNITNELLKSNADTLKMASIEAAKESERGIVDIETIRHTNQTLITSLDEVMKIQSEGSQKRKDAEMEIKRLEDELKNKMLQIATDKR